MRIERVEAQTVQVPFREPFVSGAMRWEHRRIGLVSLRTDTGLLGLGEYPAPSPDDLGESVGPRLVATLEGLDMADAVTLAAVLRQMDRWPFVGRVARSAVESAIVDLLARATRRTVAAALSSGAVDDVRVNGTVGVEPPEVAAAEAARYVARGFSCLKLKGGNEPVAVLGDRVAAVRDAVGPSVELRVDFNGSLEAATAAATLETLATHRLEYAEQPIAPTAGAAALARLRRDTAVPIAADEAVRDLGTARELVELQAVDALVVKPARVGGLRQAYALVELATAAGVSVTLSTLFESGVGLAGALHLAAATPGGQAHGLATAELLESDLLEAALPISAGRMAVPRGPGIGVALDADAVERYRVE